ncbi:MAG: archaellin/type IV pilin N-terminal domain-containing protein [Candidatus Bathyarchaeia archaeon]
MSRKLASRKGISPILATLLLVVIAVGAVVITYAWVITFTGTQTTTAGKMIRFDSASINAASDNVTIYVRNWGTEHVKIDAVYIDGTDCTQFVDQTLPMSIPVDGRVEVTLSGGGLADFEQGSIYRVKITGPGVSWEESVKAL